MQKKNKKKAALLQAIDPITKQHTTTLKGVDFNMRYTVVMKFLNNAIIGRGRTIAPGVNVINGAESYYVEGDELQDQGHRTSGLRRSTLGHVRGRLDLWTRECP